MQKLEFNIIDLDNKARGVAKHQGLTYFVEGAKLGQKVLAQVTKDKKSYKEARLIEVLEESPYVVENSIIEADLCGVYELYDIDYKRQVEFKKNNIINQLNRIGGKELDDIDFVEANCKTHYRNKLELKLSPQGDLSYFSRSTNDNIPINRCVMNTKEINEVIQGLKHLLKKHKIKGYNARYNQGLIKNIIIRSTSLGQTMLIIVYNNDYKFDDFVIDIAKENLVDSFYISKNTKPRNYKIMDLDHIYGQKKIKEEISGHYFMISPKAFMQVNKEVSEKIYKKAGSYIKEIKPGLLIDLYSGISTTSILFSDLAEKIISVEINTDAVEDAKENARLNKVSNIEWINKPAEIAIENIPLSSSNPLALFDPPRRGLEEKIIHKIGKSTIKHLVYISCNPSSLARDIKRFKEYGFELVEVTGFDQFVQTLHVECVVLMTKREAL